MGTVLVNSKSNVSNPDGTEEILAGGTNDQNITTSVMLQDRKLSKSVAGASNVTLTLQECLYGQIVLTGTLTGNINVSVQDSISKRWNVYNNTSGSFTLTFKTASGTGITIPQGTRDILTSDGTNVFSEINPLNLGIGSELTVSTGSVTATSTYHSVDGEGDASDDLATINGGIKGDVLFLKPENAARDITLKHGTGNIVMPDGIDYTIPDNGVVCLLFDGTNWRTIKPENDHRHAFLVTSAANQENFALNVDVTVVFGTEIKDAGNNFASNTFTAPVDGVYQLSCVIRMENLDTGATMYYAAIVTSNRTYYCVIDPSKFSADPAYWSFTISMLCDMDASDTAYVVVNQAGGAQQSDLLSGLVNFSGFRACDL